MIKLKDILKESSGFYPTDPGPKRWFKPYGDKYSEYEKATNKELSEFNLGAMAGGIAGARGRSGGTKVTPEFIENNLSKYPGMDNYGISVSERGSGEWRIRFNRTRRPIDDKDWKTAIKFVEQSLKGKIDKNWTRNDYEPNWEPEEPAEWVPSIYFTV